MKKRGFFLYFKFFSTVPNMPKYVITKLLITIDNSIYVKDSDTFTFI